MATRTRKAAGRSGGRAVKESPRAPLTAHRSPQYRGVFPNSSKVYLEGPHGIRVPMREIALSGGESPLRLYDTSGPEGYDVRVGLPALREAWVLARDVE